MKGRWRIRTMRDLKNNSDENTAWNFVSSLAQLYESRANEDGIMNPNEQRQAPSRWANEGGLIGIRNKGYWTSWCQLMMPKLLSALILSDRLSRFLAYLLWSLIAVQASIHRIYICTYMLVDSCRVIGRFIVWRYCHNNTRTTMIFIHSL